eukprot:Skav230199  [mRNA]  locus=scaffold1418:422090:422512:+ [translate_table: standard]
MLWPTWDGLFDHERLAHCGCGERFWGCTSSKLSKHSEELVLVLVSQLPLLWTVSDALVLHGPCGERSAAACDAQVALASRPADGLVVSKAEEVSGILAQLQENQKEQQMQQMQQQKEWLWKSLQLEMLGSILGCQRAFGP